MIKETPRLYIRHLLERDANRLVEYRNKEEVARYQSWDHYTYDEAIIRIRECIRHRDYMSSMKDCHMAIVDKKTHIILGDIYIDVKPDKTFCMGYTLDSVYWGQGYATEAVSAILDYMKDNGFKRVICYVYIDNAKSIALLNRLGFKQFEISYFYQDIGYVKYL